MSDYFGYSKVNPWTASCCECKRPTYESWSSQYIRPRGINVLCSTCFSRMYYALWGDCNHGPYRAPVRAK